MSCWEPTLKPFLDRLGKEEKQIDVLLISHFDADHLGGALRLLERKDYSRPVRKPSEKMLKVKDAANKRGTKAELFALIAVA